MNVRELLSEFTLPDELVSAIEQRCCVLNNDAEVFRRAAQICINYGDAIGMYGGFVFAARLEKEADKCHPASNP